MIQGYIPQIIIIAAIVGIVVFIARKVPKVKEELKGKIPDHTEASVAQKKKQSEAFWKRFLGVFTVAGKGIYAGVLGVLKGGRAGVSIVKREVSKRIKDKPRKKTGTPNEGKTSSVFKARDKNLKRAEKKYPEDPGLHSARKLKGEGRIEDAEKSYINLIVKNPKDHRAYEELGRLYMEQKNYKDAASSFEEALSHGTPNEKNVEALAAKSNFEAGRFSKAIDHAENATKIDGKDTDSLAIIAKVHKKNKNDTLERIAWEKITALNPDHKEAGERLTELKKD